MGLLDYIKEQKDLAMADYAGLLDMYPNAKKFSKSLLSNIEKNIPSNKDLNSPERMKEWSLVASLNSPMMGVTKFSKAHKLAQKNAALPIEKGGLGLPANNTAMDRAREMGFDINMPMYHGTSSDFNNFDLFEGGGVSRSPVGKLGVSLTDNPDLANEFAMLAGSKMADQAGNAASNVLPLLHRKSSPASVRLPDDVLNSEVFGAVVDAWKQGHDALKLNNYITPSGKKIGDAFLIKDPNQIRSIFAAFDPMKKNSSNILASSLLGSILLDEMNNKDNK